MKAKILSLNVGVPERIEWNGRSVVTSMRKTPQAGPLVVHEREIEGDRFASPSMHGNIDSIVYAWGLKSLMSYMHLLGRDTYEYGALGENVTCDDLDETQVSVGDIFKIGEVLAQATYPRIPCAKVDLRMQHAKGRQLLVDVGRSGVNFRVLKPGKIFLTDTVELVEEAKIKFFISDVYQKDTSRTRLNKEEIESRLANGAFPLGLQEKWRALKT